MLNPVLNEFTATRINLSQKSAISKGHSKPNAIKSHGIRENWHLYESIISKDMPWGMNRLPMCCKFTNDGVPIGEAEIILKPTIATIMTCHLKVEDFNLRGQRLGPEFAARAYMRAYELAKIIGWNPIYAHAYTYYTEREVNEGRRNSPPALGESLLRMGMRVKTYEHIKTPIDPLDIDMKLLDASCSYPGSYHYYDNLDDLYNRCLENWTQWFYADRFGTAAAGIDLKQAEETLNDHFDEARASLRSSLQQLILKSCYSEQPEDIVWSIKGDAYYGQHDFDNAKLCYEKSFELKPKKSVLFRIYRIIRLQGNNEEARALFLKHFPSDPAAWL